MVGKRLVILVEGDSEVKLMNRLIIPKLYEYITSEGITTPWSIEVCKIITNRQLNKKGGNVNYKYLKNDIRSFASQGVSITTTFFDFFRLPTSFPGHTTDGNAIDDVESAMKEDLKTSIPNLQTFIPYIQKYEFEALLFSGMEGFEFLIDDKENLAKIQSINDEYPNPEDINGGRDTSPSKRLMKIFDYHKVGDSEDIIEILGFEKIYNKCPRFAQWYDSLTNALNTNSTKPDGE